MVAATTSDAGSTPSGARITSGEGLQAVNLACRRGERRLFSGLNLRLRPGQLIWLRADNGRGKTSLLRLLAGLAAPAEGRVLLGDRPVRQAIAAGQPPVYIGHANGLKDDLSAAETLAFTARLHGRLPTAEAGSAAAAADGGAPVQAALARLGLASRVAAPVRTLSQGQRRRVALARLAIELQRACEPQPWILDEPYDALDSAGIGALDAMLTEHLARGGSAILTSHQALAASAPPAHTAWLRRDGIDVASEASAADSALARQVTAPMEVTA
ncbi:MAG: heme ABC exporter ATP-binding protein CcmA [Leptothrix sp. (in: b-proteobacteria)]